MCSGSQTADPTPQAGLPLWSAADYWWGSAVALLGFAVYFWTAAPNVTLLDSGEFVVAAQHFGVPHPTGYPLWTILAWLFQLLPLGNPAWEVALFSGVTGALATGVFTLLARSGLRWLFPGGGETASGMIAAGWGLLLAFSESMWSQAVIAEVYTLHALLVALFFVALYVFVRRPHSDRALLTAFFLLALGFSNHHLVLVLAPLPFLAVLLLRRELLWNLGCAALLTGVLYFLLFAILLGEPATLKTANRFAWLGLSAFVVFTAWRRGRIGWKWVGYLPVVVTLGLLPYAYMPLASATNPPMNWGYARTAEGFAYSVNRSQYGGSLHAQLVRTVGRLVGTSNLLPRDEPGAAAEPWEAGRAEKIQRWVAFVWFRLAASFTLLCVPAFFLSILLLRAPEVAQRTWLYLLQTGFFAAAFLQPLLDGAEIDRAGWWLQMPYHTYTKWIFAMVCVLGTAAAIDRVGRRRPRLGLALACFVPLLAIWPLVANYAVCSQRDRWFGWEFGHRMLADLPEGAVVFGGTDPGRFVPTYMIFGESTARPDTRRDPGFDRRDLYILTQNALADPFYLRYIRDHYSDERPGPRNAFERWLGRDSIYPERSLKLPSLEEVREIGREALAPGRRDTEAHSEVARWIFENNRDQHDFFVEESFALLWSYDHAVPHGIVYRIHPEPLDELDPADVAADLDYWRDLTERLLGDPLFPDDFDARRAFSKLRETTGRIYQHREMTPEAETAFRQAIALHPSNLGALLPFSRILWEQGRYEEAAELWREARADDPNSDATQYLWAVAERRKQWQEDIDLLLAVRKADPGDLDSLRRLVEIYFAIAEEEAAVATILKAEAALGADPEFLDYATTILGQAGRHAEALRLARSLAGLRPTDGMRRLALAAIELQAGNPDVFFHEAAEAARIGGYPVRERLLADPQFREIRSDPRFNALFTGTPLPGEQTRQE